MKIANLTYRCNSKELEDRIEGFHFYDYGARFYEPALARWHFVDPLAEKGRQWSPYTYVFNTTMNFTDPDGRWGRRNWVRFFVNWLGLNGNENDEKRELPKDELASNKNISEEDIAYTIFLDDVPVERSSDGDGINGKSELSDGLLLEGRGNITGGIQVGCGVRKGVDASLNIASWSLLSGSFNNQTGTSGYYFNKNGEMQISQGASASYWGGIQYQHDFNSKNGVVSNEKHTVSFGVLGILAHDRVYNANGKLLNTFSGISVNYQAALVI